ncbi:MAG: protein kinase [bacterium]|nr:protein kinase [bacterium]
MSRAAPEKIGPYRIGDKLGEGGMGEVYSAYDEDLDRRVAIKLIRAVGTDSGTSQERFRREARTIAALDHPAIVRIHHVQQWEDRDCIVMEYVDGQTLTTLLRDGPLDLGRALTLALEITGGLAAAHAQGLVHRDLKTDNVMVTPDGRAKILDFGLAKRLVTESGEPTLSVEGRIMGTFHSMSPEQAYGDDLNHRSDLFSLGTLLYQVVTGVTPFRGLNATETLARVCMHRQPPALQLNQQTPEELSELIDRLLEKKPDRRPQSAVEVMATLRRLAEEAGAVESSAFATVDLSRTSPRDATPIGGAVGAGISPPHSTRGDATPTHLERPDSSTVDSVRSTMHLGHPMSPPRRKLMVPVAFGVVVAVALGLLAYMVLPGERQSVAVLGFEDRTETFVDAWKSTAITEILTADLAAGGRIRTIGGARTARVVDDLGLKPSPQLADEELKRLGLNLEVDYFVVGFYGDNLQLELCLQPAAGGDQECVSADGGPRQGLFEVVHSAAVKLRQELGAGALSPEQERQVAASYPLDPAAAKEHALGLERLRRFDSRGARERLEGALEFEPHPLTYRALAEVLFALGYEEEAQEKAQAASDAAIGLPEEKRRELEAYSHFLSRRFLDAIRIYSALFDDFPNEIEYGLRLAQNQIGAGKIEEARETVDILWGVKASEADQAEIGLLAASVHYYSDELEEAADFIDEVVKRSGKAGAKHLKARALSRQADVKDSMGEYQAALQALAEARGLFEVTDDQKGLADAFDLTGVALVHVGDRERARRQFERSLRMYKESGNVLRAAESALNLGVLSSELGDHGKAEIYFQEGVPPLLEAMRSYSVASAYLNWGAALQEAGGIEAAQEKYEQAKVHFEELGDRHLVAQVLTNAGEVLYLQGNLEEARLSFTKARGIYEELEDRSGEGYVGFRQGEVLTAMGNLAAARKSFGQALEIQKDLRIDAETETTNVALAELEIHYRNFGRAMELATDAEEILWAEDMDDQAIMAQVIQARLLLEGHKLKDAQELALIIAGHADHSQNFRVRLAAEMLNARVDHESGEADTSTTLRKLTDLRDRAAEAGFVVDAFEARFALGAIEMKAGKTADARARFKALTEDADAIGLQLVVDRVRDLAGEFE